MIDVLVGVVHAERLVDGGALVHELYGAVGVGGDVADGQQSAKRRRGRRLSGLDEKQVDTPTFLLTMKQEHIMGLSCCVRFIIVPPPPFTLPVFLSTLVGFI